MKWRTCWQTVNCIDIPQMSASGTKIQLFVWWGIPPLCQTGRWMQWLYHLQRLPLSGTWKMFMVNEYWILIFCLRYVLMGLPMQREGNLPATLVAASGWGWAVDTGFANVTRKVFPSVVENNVSYFTLKLKYFPLCNHKWCNFGFKKNIGNWNHWKTWISSLV